MALKQVFKSGEREGGAEGRQDAWRWGDNDLFRAPRSVLLFKQEHCHVIPWQTLAIISPLSPILPFFPSSFSFTHPSLLFPKLLSSPPLSISISSFSTCPSLTLSIPFLSFSPSERRVSLEYELDYSSAPPPPNHHLLLSLHPLIWFSTSVSPQKAEDENLSKIGYILFQGATIAAGTDTF